VVVEVTLMLGVVVTGVHQVLIVVVNRDMEQILYKMDGEVVSGVWGALVMTPTVTVR